jgi:molybdopterin molybdotransferase
MLKHLVSVSEAIDLLAKALSETIALDTEEVGLLEATGRIIAHNIVASEDRPLEDSSAVDGYAVRSIDTTGASHYNPVMLRNLGVLRPGGSSREFCVEPGTTVRVHTGAPIPCGSDAVLMDEDVGVEGGIIYVYRAAAKGLNVIYRGEDFRAGEVLGERGFIANPPLLAALASVGLSRVRVYRRIKVSLLSIGDELVEPGRVRARGKSYNSTTYILYSLLDRDSIFSIRYAGILPDNPAVVRDAILREVSGGADIVITTGGTGVSEADVVGDVADRSERIVFRGVKLRPGRPTSCFILGGRVVLSLSGFPVAAWTGYEVIFRRSITKWLGLKGFDRRYIYAVLARRVPNTVGYTSVIRVSIRDVNGEVYAEPYMLRGSGVISSLLKTNGYILIPEELEGFEKNSVVRVYLYE